MEIPNIDKIIEQRQMLEPDKFLIYFLLRDNKVVYVGQTEGQFWTRCRCHIKNGMEFDAFALFNVLPEEANDSEARCIVQYSPIYNVVLPPNSLFVSALKLSDKLAGIGIEKPHRKLAKELKKKGILPVWEFYYLRTDLPVDWGNL